jgi:penicillin-binding protein 2
LGVERIAEYAKTLGLGSLTGIDLPGEKEGLVPTEEWSRNVRKTDWYPGETISLSIGQGPLLVTPLQVAFLTAILANRGRKVVPHLLKFPSQALKQAEEIADSPARIISAGTFEKVIKGMWKSVNEGGTGHFAMVEEFDVCGKTGSTQLISRERAAKLGKEIKPHSWFTGFAPRDNPQVVVTVLVEYGGMGGATAAPLAKELFNLYKNKYD